MPKSSAQPPVPATLDAVASSRTDIFFLKPSDMEPGLWLNKDGTTEKLNTRTDFGDTIPLRDSFLAGIESGGPKNAIREYLRGYFDKATGKFKITDGERRWTEALILEHEGHEIYCPVRPEPKGYTQDERNLDVLLSQSGVHLSMMERAKAMKRAIDSGFDMATIARRSGCSATHVKDCLDLLVIPEPLRDAVAAGEVTPTLALQISKTTSSDQEAADLLDGARSNASTAGADHIMAKHLPTPNPAPHTPFDPFAGKDCTPDTPVTDDEGVFIEGIIEIPVPFQTKGVSKGTIYLAFIEDKPPVGCSPAPGSKPTGLWYWGFRLAWPSLVKGAGYICDLPRNTELSGGRVSETRTESTLAALLSMRAELDNAEFLNKPDALAEMDTYINALSDAIAAATGQFHTPPPGNANPPIGSAPAPAPVPPPALNPQEELLSILNALTRKQCDPPRYDTLKVVVSFLKGKIAGTDLTKFLLGI